MAPETFAVRWEVAHDERFSKIAAKGKVIGDPRARGRGARRREGPRARPRVLLPVSRRERGERGRPHTHRARRGVLAEAPAHGVRVVPGLRGGVLRRPPAPRGRGRRRRVLARRLHLRERTRLGRARARRTRGHGRPRVPTAIRHVQGRSRPAGCARCTPVGRHVGRPRDRQQLRRRPRRPRRPPARSRSSSGVQPPTRCGGSTRPVRLPPPGGPDYKIYRNLVFGDLARRARARHAPVPVEPAVQRDERHQRRLPGDRRPRADDPRSRAEALADARARQVTSAMGRARRSRCCFSPTSFSPDLCEPDLQRRWVGRVPRRARRGPESAEREAAERRRHHRRHPLELGERRRGGRRRQGSAVGRDGVRGHVDHVELPVRRGPRRRGHRAATHQVRRRPCPRVRRARRDPRSDAG